MNKNESRYFKTAVRMNDALLALLEKKPFEYITVSEVCREAGVNRSTFYLHYENTSELLYETFGRMTDGFLAYFSVDRSKIMLEFSGCAPAEMIYITDEYLLPFLQYIRDNQRIFLTVLTHEKAFGTERVFQNMFRNIFDPILERFGYPSGDREYVMRFYMQGISAVIAQWLGDECDRSLEEISRIIRECILGLEHWERPRL